MTPGEALELHKSDPTTYIEPSRATVVRQVRTMVEFQRRGVMVFDYDNNFRQEAYNHGYKDAFAFPGFVEAFIRPLFCVGRGPFRWICLSGELAGPVAMSRDHFDTGSVASPNRETEGTMDGRDAVADWPILNALLNTACGATCVAVRNVRGVGIGYATHARLVVLADGTEMAE